LAFISQHLYFPKRNATASRKREDSTFIMSPFSDLPSNRFFIKRPENDTFFPLKQIMSHSLKIKFNLSKSLIRANN